MGYIGTKPADAALTSADIADGVVTAAKLATDSVETAKVKDLNVSAGKLAATQDLSTKTITLPASVAGLGTGITNTQLAGSIDVTSKITGTIPTANLGSGSASATTILYGDQSYKVEPTTDLTPLRQDIITLALKQGVQENMTKHNLPSSAVVTFQADADFNLAGSTDISRNASKYISTAGSALLSSNFDFTNQDSYLYVVETDVALDNRATFTQEVWVSPVTYDTTTADKREGGIWGSFNVDGYGTALQTHEAATLQSYYWAASNSGGGWVTGGGNTGVTSPSIDTWHHFAEVQSGGTIKLYQDGTQIDTFTTTGGILFATNVGIGFGAYSGSRPFKGYMNDWRISSTARYTTTFTPSTDAFVSDSDTLLLVQSDTTDGSTTFTDSSSNGFTITRNAGSLDNSTAIASNLSAATVGATGTALGTTNVPTSAVTEVSGVMLMKNAYGTNILGTDVKAYFTADNSNWTEAASYTDSGTFSDTTKMITLGKTTVTSGSDVRWKIVYANQVASTKVAQIYGIGTNY